MIYAYADQRGYGYCAECKPDDRRLDEYTPDAGEACEVCGRDLRDAGVRVPTDGIRETTVCRIF